MNERIKKIEKDMYSVANKIVGNVGQQKKALISPTGEEYVYFGIFAETLDEVLPLWKKWVKGYCVFKSLTAPKYMSIERNPELYIYWFVRPLIAHEPLYKKTQLVNKKIEIIEEGPMTYFVRAYLLISRFNTDSTILDDPRKWLSLQDFPIIC